MSFFVALHRLRRWEGHFCKLRISCVKKKKVNQDISGPIFHWMRHCVFDGKALINIAFEVRILRSTHVFFCHLLLYVAVHFRFLLLPRPICCDGRLRAPYPHVSSLASFKHGVILPHRFHGNGCTTNMIFHISPRYVYQIYIYI